MKKTNNLSPIGQDEQKGSKFVACPTIITYDNKINALILPLLTYIKLIYLHRLHVNEGVCV
ncbi:hypothetical protein C4588_00880 [Candidatus Parcubacteria bacterium]|nr:MAG: hypothetical protein C4588_00880 [Candidatus Parcubacteria bacterium]